PGFQTIPEPEPEPIPEPVAGEALGTVVEDELPDGTGNDPDSAPLTVESSGSALVENGTITGTSYNGGLGAATQDGLNWSADDGSWTMTIDETGNYVFSLT